MTQKVASSSVQVSVLSYCMSLEGELFYVQGLSVCVPVYMIICVFCMLMCVILYSNCISVCIFVGVGGLSPSVRPFVLHICIKCAF